MVQSASNKARLGFPLKGLDENWAYTDQPDYSSPSLLNVRPRDTGEGRARGGQRPGLKKMYSQQIKSGETETPVLRLIQVTITSY